MPAPTDIPNTAALDSLLAGLAPGQLALLDFHAVWCGPCKFVAPVLGRIAKAYPDVVVAKIDVDQCKELAQRYGVTAMPTFKYIKNQGGKPEVVDTLRGADAKGLVKLVEKHSARAAAEEVKLDDLAVPEMPPYVRLLMYAVVGWVIYQYLKTT
jgi:thiol-disulfide isomerase/thioredoxin